MKSANNAPVYASLYAELAEVFQTHGYALAIHGSLARDFDLVAIPWVHSPANPLTVLQAIEKAFALKIAGPPEPKPHGRSAYSMVFAGGIACLDISFTPRSRQ